MSVTRKKEEKSASNEQLPNSSKKLIDQLKIEKEHITTAKEVSFPGFFQPSQIHKQIDYQPLQLSNGNILHLSKREISGFEEGSYNLFVNGQLEARDVSEDEVEKIYVKYLATQKRQARY